MRRKRAKLLRKQFIKENKRSPHKATFNARGEQEIVDEFRRTKRDYIKRNVK